jgi:hypothetical protein
MIVPGINYTNNCILREKFKMAWAQINIVSSGKTLPYGLHSLWLFVKQP